MHPLVQATKHLQYRIGQGQRLVLRLRSHGHVWSHTRHLHGPLQIARQPLDCIVLSLVRDSAEYIVPFIEHYLALGAKHIVLLDNGSQDATVAKASQYDQVTVLQCLLPFRDYKREMRQFLMDRYSWNRWCILADSDEFLDYPLSHQVSLEGLLHYLETYQYDAVLTHMLDMFSNQPIVSNNPAETAPFQTTHRWFEMASIQAQPIPSGLSNRLPATQLKMYRGGVRDRVFHNAPFLSKFAILKPNLRLQLVGSHLVNWAAIADIPAVLYHYKFLPQFSQLVENAIQEKQYYNNSSEYVRYQAALQDNPVLSLYSEQAIELTGTQQLVELGFLQVSPPYQQFSQQFSQSSIK